VTRQPQPQLTTAERPAPVRGGWGQSARLALGTTAALGLARFAYGLLLPAMRSQLHWSLAEAGTLTTANSAGYLVGALIAAPAERRLGVATVFRVGMIATTAALAACAATGSYPALLAARAVSGVAGALVFIAGGVMASRAAASARSAVPVTIYYAGAGAGIAFSGILLPPLLGDHPGRWPLAWLILAAGSALASGVSWAAGRGGQDKPAGSTVTGSTVTSSAAGRLAVGVRSLGKLYRPAITYLLFGAGYIAYITFLSAYLAAHHASTTEAVLTWTLLGLAAMAGPALWSTPLSTWPRTSALAAALALVGLAAAVALASATAVAVVGSAVGYGATFLVVPAAITQLIRKSVPPPGWTAALAAFTVVFAAGQTAGPYLAGALADHYGTGAILTWTAALCVAGAGLAAAAQP
jgi:predicted MFS family arabinose efflux permease